MKIGEQWEYRTLCATKIKARTEGEKGRHLWHWLVREIAEGKTSYELSWTVKVKNVTRAARICLYPDEPITSPLRSMCQASSVAR